MGSPLGLAGFSEDGCIVFLCCLADIQQLLKKNFYLIASLFPGPLARESRLFLDLFFLFVTVSLVLLQLVSSKV